MTKQALLDRRIQDAMAFDRKSFKNKLLGILSGAMAHFYMVQLAERNGQTKWVQHWRTEIDRLLNMDFVLTVLSEIKGHWDKRRAIAEILDDVRAADGRYRTYAVNYVTKVYHLKKLKKDLPADVADEFYQMVHDATELALSPNASD